jgi:hypothetical protein
MFLVPALDVGVEPVQLLLVLADHRADDVADGDHPHHPRAVNHRDVPDALFCHQLHRLQHSSFRFHRDQLVLSKS